MLNLDRRVQLMLDEARYRKIAQEAARRQVSVASVIRDAIDRLPEQEGRRRDAIAQILAADAMPCRTIWPSYAARSTANTSRYRDDPADPLIVLDITVLAGSRHRCDSRPGRADLKSTPARRVHLLTNNTEAPPTTARSPSR